MVRFHSVRGYKPVPVIKSLLVPLKPVLKRFYGLRARGDFRTWDEALARASEYDAEEILKATVASTIEAKNAGYVLNPSTERILSAIENFRPARVLDFGGAMGRCYFTLKSRTWNIAWDVVELPATVRRAREFEDDRLHFWCSVSAPPAPDLVVASGSLQYCQSPTTVLSQLKQLDAPLLLDRVPVAERRQLAIQIVTKPFKARVPVWFLSFADFGNYPSWDCGESIWLNGKNVPYIGFLIEPAKGR
jgi:putative methyltransferase (TIGR04325 family)